MFINCPYCRALVATDPVSDLPPPLCPECRGPLREGVAADGAVAGVQANAAQADETQDRELAAGNVFIETAPLGPALASTATTGMTDTTGIANASPPADPAAPLDLSVAADLTGPADPTDLTDLDDSAGTAETAPTESTDAPGAEPTPPPSAAPPRPDTRRRAGQATPSFARQAQAEPAAAARLWPAMTAIAALALLLALQMVLADRARLAGDARWRPVLEGLCATLRCSLPPWREPAAFTLLQRDVRQHPTVPGALRVSASFRNDARWPQPWPALELTLSDVNGRPAGERRFVAREYLGGAPAQQMLASGETATVAMDILEPAAQIVAYDFRFR